MVDYFITAINDHRDKQLTPPNTTGAEENISFLCHESEHWTGVVLLHYVHFKRNHENGCKGQHTSSSKSRMILNCVSSKTPFKGTEIEKTLLTKIMAKVLHHVLVRKGLDRADWLLVKSTLQP